MVTNTWHAQRTCCCTECREMRSYNRSSFKSSRTRKTLVKLLVHLPPPVLPKKYVCHITWLKRIQYFLEACCCFHNIIMRSLFVHSFLNLCRITRHTQRSLQLIILLIGPSSCKTHIRSPKERNQMPKRHADMNWHTELNTVTRSP